KDAINAGRKTVIGMMLLADRHDVISQPARFPCAGGIWDCFCRAINRARSLQSSRNLSFGWLVSSPLGAVNR
ncbi:hypothetical protein, partial [Aeromonas rivipollensis]|uniref:hypothetical protein n=1 Tax=Aeromonas rivipollensis TaxID=948519 RepID=UPI003D1E600A